MVTESEIAKILPTLLIASITLNFGIMAFSLNKYIKRDTRPMKRPYFWSTLTLNIALVFAFMSLIIYIHNEIIAIEFMPELGRQLIFSMYLFAGQMVTIIATTIITSVAVLKRN